eukprot:TRINITY_DN29489_c0_g1_i2.p1 TRINITY_DN29489_c0_g1~~TRINITY_DN29489_c0_g1_i2.p1  ORF type:complete len:434 (+),score=64.92 TRINITY_DN29489_c0_g1_i2:41-1303(+)
MASQRTLEVGLSASREQDCASAASQQNAEALPLSTAVTTLTQNILGAGVLALPFALRSAGIAGGLSLLCLVYVLSVLSMAVLVLLGNALGSFSYFDAAASTLGRRLATAVEIWVLCYNIGICISYPILLGDMIFDLAEHFGAGDWNSRKGCMTAAIALVCWPLSCAPSLGGLRYMSTVGVGSILLCAVAVGKRYFDNSYFIDGNAPELAAFELSTFGSCFPILVGAFGAHYNIPALYREVAPGAGSKDWGKTDEGQAAFQRMLKVIAYAVTISSFIYGWIGLAVYATFGSETKSDFTKNFRPDDTWLVVVRFTMACAICASFPLTMVSARTAAFNLLLKPRGYAMTPTMRICLATSLTLFCLGVAAAAGSLGTVLTYNGSVFGTPVCFIAPAAMYLMLPRLSDRAFLFLFSGPSLCQGSS